MQLRLLLLFFFLFGMAGVASPVLEGDGLLSAIYENPDSLAERLIYADWLEDAGDPERAEFIRIPCGAQIPTSPWRERELCSQNEFKWGPPFPGVLGVEYREGFPYSIILTQDGFRKAAAILRHTPTLRELLIHVRFGMDTDVLVPLSARAGERQRQLEIR